MIKGKSMLLMIGYFVPYIFLSMAEDAVRGSCWFYIVSIAAFGVLTSAAVNMKDKTVIIAGNLISCTSSMACIAFFQTEKWLWYFKPFGPFSLAAAISFSAFVFQIVYYIRSVKRR